MVGTSSVRASLVRDVAVHVAVGQMMDDLPDRPASGTVRGIELAAGEILHQCSYLTRQRFDTVDPASVLLRRWLRVLAQPPNRVPE